MADQERGKVRNRLVGPDGAELRILVQTDDEEPREVQLTCDVKHDARSFQVSFGPDGDSVAIADQWIGAATWDFRNKGRHYETRGVSAVISPDGRFLAASGYKEVELWDLKNDRLFKKIPGHVREGFERSGSGGSLAFSPDGRFLALGTGYPYNWGTRCSDVIVWKVPSFEEIGGTPLYKGDHTNIGVTFTFDSKWLVVADRGGTVRAWDTSTWKLKRSMKVGTTVFCMAISPDGKTLGLGCTPHGVALWDFETGKQRDSLRGHTAWAITFSPDGRTLVSTARDHTAVLWDVESGMQLRTFHGHTDAVCGGDFSPDGNSLATSGTDGVLRLWDALPLEEIDCHPMTQAALLERGRVQNQQLKFDEAAKTLRATFEKRQSQALSSDHPDLAETGSELAIALKGLGQWLTMK